MKYRSTEQMLSAIGTFQRAINQLRKKADELEDTDNLELTIEAFGIIKNLHNNIHLDNWASALKRDIEDKKMSWTDNELGRQ